MDIRIDTGFHHKNPYVYIPPSCINNPNNQYNPKYMPLTIFNLSKVDHLYIGRDTMVTFAEEPTIDTYHIELPSEEKIKEHLAKSCNWVPQRHKTLPEIPPDTAFICSPADVPGPCVRHNLTMHCSVTPFVIRQPIHRPHLPERVYKPICTSH